MRNLLLKFLSTLSLEVSLSASILSFILAQLLNVFVPPLYYIILSLSVLTIYSLDHALDAKNTPPENLQQAPPPTPILPLQ